MLNSYEYPDYLAHYGVKGMKWGVRRASRGQSNSGGRGSKAKAKPTKSQPVVNRASKRAHSGAPATSLSNQELQSRINRLNMEQQYNRLTQSDPQVSRGRKAATAALAGTGAVASTVAIKAVKNATQPYVNDLTKKGVDAGIDLIKRKVLS